MKKFLLSLSSALVIVSGLVFGAGEEYYDHTTFPSPGAVASSSAMRAELDLIEAGFDKLVDLSGNGNKLMKVNSGATAHTTSIISDDGSTATVAGALTATGAITGNSLSLTTSLPVTSGGTGRATGTTAYGLIAAGTTATGAQQTLAAGATTEILVGGGASALPVWTTATGSGSPVRATSPTLETPTLGVATATSINGNTITTGTGTLTLGAGSTLATSATNSITLTSTGPTNVTLPTSGTLINSTDTAAKATILSTARAIYGNNFDGSAALTQVIASTYGGTGNGFTKFSGPTTAEKTFTLPDANATLLYSGGALGTPSSGTLTNATGLPSAGVVGTAATLAGSEELTNKTLNASVAKGTWTASGTWTLPALTLGGNVSSTGNPTLSIGAITSSNGASANTLAVQSTGAGSLAELSISGKNSGNTARQVTFGINRTIDDYWGISNGTTTYVRGSLTSGGLAVLVGGIASAGALTTDDGTRTFTFSPNWGATSLPGIGTTTNHAIPIYVNSTEVFRFAPTALTIGSGITSISGGTNPSLNIGMGELTAGAISTSDAITTTKSANSGVLNVVSNTNAGASASAGLQLTSDAGSSYVFMGSTANTPSKALVLQNNVAGGTIQTYIQSTAVTSVSSTGLGIGSVTPSAWGSAQIGVEVGAAGNGLVGTTNGADTLITQNAYKDSGGTWRYVRSAAATLYDVSGGTHAFFSATSGTAGNAISWTTPVTISSTGLAVTGGVIIGSATGGTIANSLNVAGDIYKNNTAYTNPDYVLEKWATGRIVKFAENDGASGYDGLMPLASVEEFARQNLHLPRFGQQAGHGLFSGSDALLASVEEAYLYLFEQSHRIEKLEQENKLLNARLEKIEAYIAANDAHFKRNAFRR